MSFLTLKPSTVEFSQCIISFWYRLPGSTVGPDDDISELSGGIPLVVLGNPLQQFDYIFKDVVIATGPNFGADGEVLSGYWEISSWTENLGNDSKYSDPVHIALTGGNLSVNLNFAGDPDVTNWAFDPNGVVTTTDGAGSTIYTPAGHTDVSVINLLRGKRESYQFFPPTLSGLPSTDQWHHVLLSTDLGSVSVASQRFLDPNFGKFTPAFSGYSKVWCSVDDAPIDLVANQNFRLIDQPKDAIISKAQYTIATVPYNPDFLDMTFVLRGIDRPIDPISGLPFGSRNIGIGTFSVIPAPVPAYSFAPTIKCETMGIPAHARFKKSVRQVEMAEFKMWIGTSSDVRKEDVRRLFITKEGKPNLSSDAVDALGRPTILLHKSGNWIKGRNTGTDDDQFTPTGKIKAYKPDPSLYGKQKR